MTSREWDGGWDGLAAAAVEHLPAVVLALLVLVVGWIVARLLAAGARSLTDRLLGRAASRWRIGPALESSGARAATPGIVRAVVFWSLLLVAAVVAVEILGLEIVTGLLGRLVAYVPNVIAAAALLVGGVVLARLARDWVARGAVLMRLEPQAAAVAGFVSASILAVAAVMALESLGIEGRVLELMLAIVLGSVMLALALAFALGARDAVADIVAARDVGRHVRVGQRVRAGEVRGRVVELTPTTVVVETADGRILMPASRFHRSCPVLEEES